MNNTLHGRLETCRLRNVFYYITLVVIILVALASTAFLPQGRTAFALTYFDNEHRSTIVDMQHQDSRLVTKLKVGNMVTTNLDEIFKVKLNQTATMGLENLTIKLVDVNDFRCPSDVVCIWEGDGVVSLNLTQNGHDLGPVTLGVNNRLANDTKTIAGQQNYILHLLALEPYPAISKPINKSDYVATLIVTKANTSTQISTILLKAGERDGPLQVTKIFPNQIRGLAFKEFPIAIRNGTAITMKIGESVSNGCNTSLTMLSIHKRDFAVFLKIEDHHKICPL